MGSGYRPFSKKQLERFFEVYRNAKIVKTTGMPSCREVARKCTLAPKTVTRLRDEHQWEARRLKIEAEADAELDKKRVASTVSKVSIYENLEKAGLNYLMSKLYQDADGKVMVDLKPAEVIALGKHAGLLRGGPDTRMGFTKDGAPIKVILNLGDNGMIRENGKTDKDND